MNNIPFFSIVIPTLNEEKFLPFLLEDLCRQSFTDFEVIHVDGDSEDNTIEEAYKFNKRIKIHSVSAKIKNVGFQRNIGINKSKGKWIIFMDADNRLPDYFLDGIKYRLAKNINTDFFSTWIKVSGDTKRNQYIEKIFNFAAELNKSIGNETALGSMIGIKNEIAQKYKFDDKQKVMEDYLFIKNLSKDGYVFNIFKDPKYIYSLRRIESNGLLNYIQVNSKILFNYFVLGNDFKNDNHGYKMNGGNEYLKSNNKFFKTFTSLENLIKSQPRNKLDKVLEVFNSFKDNF